MYTHTHTYIHTDTCTYIHTMYTHTYLYIHAEICTDTHMYIHIDTCTCIHRHTQKLTHMYTHTHARMMLCALSSPLKPPLADIEDHVTRVS
ncbi:unnamed protein product [Staurois parvus]|uniref:Uncharacterized protein n=1 Tax=Staurois parvus TaxID=386267 RepID=A0ABN9DAB3_9NEOB|nr:unnamed protein product [Staurois parvus]